MKISKLKIQYYVEITICQPLLIHNYIFYFTISILVTDEELQINYNKILNYSQVGYITDIFTFLKYIFQFLSWPHIIIFRPLFNNSSKKKDLEHSFIYELFL